MEEEAGEEEEKEEEEEREEEIECQKDVGSDGEKRGKSSDGDCVVDLRHRRRVVEEGRGDMEGWEWREMVGGGGGTS